MLVCGKVKTDKKVKYDKNASAAALLPTNGCIERPREKLRFILHLEGLFPYLTFCWSASVKRNWNLFAERWTGPKGLFKVFMVVNTLRAMFGVRLENR